MARFRNGEAVELIPHSIPFCRFLFLLEFSENVLQDWLPSLRGSVQNVDCFLELFSC